MYQGKEQTFIIDFINKAEDIKEAFEPYYKTTELEDVTDPNIIYELQIKLEANTIFSSTEVESYAKAFFNPKGTQAAMSSALKPAVDRYKSRFKEALLAIIKLNETLKLAKKNGNDKAIHNLELDLKAANEIKSGLILFKKDLSTFVKMYEFLSQIVDYSDEELEKLWAFVKGLIPNLKTVDVKDPIDISLVELSRYKLHKQKDYSIELEEGKGLISGSGGGGQVREPEKEYLSELLDQINDLFRGELTDDDKLNYARTIKDKVMENTKVIEQVGNNTKEQAMMGGFAEAINDAVIDSLEAHQHLATQVLSEDRIKQGLANIVYDLIVKGFKTEKNLQCYYKGNSLD